MYYGIILSFVCKHSYFEMAYIYQAYKYTRVTEMDTFSKYKVQTLVLFVEVMQGHSNFYMLSHTIHMS